MLFRNYQYFVAIVEAGSLTRAAKKLYVSQPSLSQYLKRLEAALGVELFDRSSSPLRLTYIGERYYQYVLQRMRLDENARREFEDIRNQTSGRLRLGVALWRGACLLPDVFPHFHRQYPGIRLELTEGSSQQLVEALMTDQIDLAVLNLPRTLNYDKLTCEIVMSERILLAAPTQHPEVQARLAGCADSDAYPLVSLDLLHHVPLVLTKGGQNLTLEVVHTLSVNGIRPDILLETGNLTTAINLAAAGMACAFVPEEGARVCQHPGKVTYFAVDCPGLVWDLAVVYQKNAYLTHLAKRFIEVVKKELGTSQAGGKASITQ